MNINDLMTMLILTLLSSEAKSSEQQFETIKHTLIHEYKLDDNCTNGLFYVTDPNDHSYIQKGIADNNLHDPNNLKKRSINVYWFKLIDTDKEIICEVYH